MTMIARLNWTDRKGRPHQKTGAAPELAARLKTIRAEATLTIDGVKVGGCESHPGEFDDQRRRWNWWYSAEAVSGPTQPTAAAPPTDDIPKHYVPRAFDAPALGF